MTQLKVIGEDRETLRWSRHYQKRSVKAKGDLKCAHQSCRVR